MDAELGQGSSIPLTPGQLLSAAREQRGLTQEAVAQQMRLSLQTIKDIEADNYVHIGVKTFVRGYLSGYARIVKIPEPRVLSAFDAMGVVFSDQVISIATMTSAQEFSRLNKHKSPKAVRWGAGIISVVVVLLLVAITREHMHHKTVRTKHALVTSIESFHLVTKKKSG